MVYTVSCGVSSIRRQVRISFLFFSRPLLNRLISLPNGVILRAADFFHLACPLLSACLLVSTAYYHWPIRRRDHCHQHPPSSLLVLSIAIPVAYSTSGRNARFRQRLRLEGTKDRTPDARPVSNPRIDTTPIVPSNPRNTPNPASPSYHRPPPHWATHLIMPFLRRSKSHKTKHPDPATPPRPPQLPRRDTQHIPHHQQSPSTAPEDNVAEPTWKQERRASRFERRSSIFGRSKSASDARSTGQSMERRGRLVRAVSLRLLFLFLRRRRRQHYKHQRHDRLRRWEEEEGGVAISRRI